MPTPRIFMGMLGGSPAFRISKPGKSVYSADVRDFLLREDMDITRARIRGTVTIPTWTAVNIDISSYGFTKPPLARAHTPGFAMDWGFTAVVLPGWQTLQINNGTGAQRLFTYFVFDNTTEWS